MPTFKNFTPKKDPNQGIHTYEGSEIANISLGQNGFDVIGADDDYLNEDETVTGDCVGNWTNGWVAIKAIGGDCNVTAESNVGDHLTITGAAPGFNAGGGTSSPKILNSDTVYGNFKKIYAESLSSGAILVCYRG
jgi:hypothetical protein